MNELTKSKKRDVGALMTWSVLNQINEHLERIDQQYLEMTRILLEHKRRLDTLAISVDHHRKILSKDNTEVTMFCIACPYEFTLPREEAEAQEYTVTCPKCGSWALLKDQIPQEFSIRDIARISGFAESTVAQTLRERGLSHKGKFQRYDESTAQKVLAILETKTRKGGRGGNSGSQGFDRGSNVSCDRENHDVRGDQHPDVA